MKRLGNLYEQTYKFENILIAFNEVCRNTKNKRKSANFKEYKSIYVSRVYNILSSRTYIPGDYNIFTIYEPKQRRIVSQNLQDKVINHLVARHILYPALLPCLIDTNVASRENLGTDAGLKMCKEYHRICKVKYGTYYILKCDIAKYFASIDHNILKDKLKKKIKDKDALKIVFDIIDMESNGLSIGTMTSQVLAVFFLNDLDHFIKETLKVKYLIRYQDDILLFHPSKQYLKFCLEEIRKFLGKEKLTLNAKTRIYKSSNNFIFLGRDKNGRYKNHSAVKRKISKRFYLYKMNKISLMSLVDTLMCYENLCKKKIANFFAT